MRTDSDARYHALYIERSIGMSWLLPLTFELGWANSLQLTLFLVAPAVLACALAIDDRRDDAALRPVYG